MAVAVVGAMWSWRCEGKKCDTTKLYTCSGSCDLVVMCLLCADSTPCCNASVSLVN